MSTSTCPYCGAETRPGDNFCLTCGNRLLPSTPSPQQAVPVVGDSVIQAEEGWAQGIPSSASAPVAAGNNWIDAAAPTIASSQAEPPTLRGEAPNTPNSANAGAQATATTIERPAKLILRAENGEVLQEYPLEKPEIAIGRAPNSDVLLSKDKLTSRRHATVRYEDNKYVLYDERSANGTFVNGQQLEEMTPYVLQDGDHVGIGEHELVFNSFGSNASNGSEADGMADMPTISVPYNNQGQEMTYRTRDDEGLTATSNDDFSTKSMENGSPVEAQPASPAPAQPSSPTAPVAEDVPVPAAPTPPVSTTAPGTSAPPPSPPLPAANSLATLNQLTDV